MSIWNDVREKHISTEEFTNLTKSQWISKAQYYIKSAANVKTKDGSSVVSTRIQEVMNLLLQTSDVVGIADIFEVINGASDYLASVDVYTLVMLLKSHYYILQQSMDEKDMIKRNPKNLIIARAMSISAMSRCIEITQTELPVVAAMARSVLIAALPSTFDGIGNKTSRTKDLPPASCGTLRPIPLQEGTNSIHTNFSEVFRFLQDPREYLAYRLWSSDSTFIVEFKNRDPFQGILGVVENVVSDLIRRYEILCNYSCTEEVVALSLRIIDSQRSLEELMERSCGDWVVTTLECLLMALQIQLTWAVGTESSLIAAWPSPNVAATFESICRKIEQFLSLKCGQSACTKRAYFSNILAIEKAVNFEKDSAVNSQSAPITTDETEDDSCQLEEGETADEEMVDDGTISDSLSIILHGIPEACRSRYEHAIRINVLLPETATRNVCLPSLKHTRENIFFSDRELPENYDNFSLTRKISERYYDSIEKIEVDWNPDNGIEESEKLTASHIDRWRYWRSAFSCYKGFKAIMTMSQDDLSSGDLAQVIPLRISAKSQGDIEMIEVPGGNDVEWIGDKPPTLNVSDDVIVNLD